MASSEREVTFAEHDATALAKRVTLVAGSGGASSPATIGHGVKNVTTAGTDEALAASTACKSVTIMAKTTNTGVIAVGTTGVDATVGSGSGVLLFAGDTISLNIANLSTVFIDSTVNGEGVRYTYTV